MRKQEHNYEIKGFKYGFRISPRDETRPILYVNVDKNGFWNFKNNGNLGTCSLYNFYGLLETCVNILYNTWVQPKITGNDSVDFNMKRWAMLTTKKSISKKLRIMWKNCCNNVDPRVEELHRKLFSVSKGTGYWWRIEGILNNKAKFKYVIDDMLKYHAARVAVLHSNDLIGRREDINTWDGNWMREYSYSGESYTSLNKTLMNLPYGILYYHNFYLKNIILPEPATNRLRLWAYLLLSRNMPDDDRVDSLFEVILRSDDNEIKEAIRFMWKYFPYLEKDDFRKHGSILHAFRLIFDYPLPIGKWSIMGLAKRSEEYHHDLEMQERFRRMEWEKQNQALLSAKTALPPIPFPEDENIKFLDSYKAVYDEGELMGHCIAQYAQNAVKGYCYLFHIDYNGEMASVEVSPNGYISQSYGPKDTKNKASEYGKTELGKWAKKLGKSKTIKTGETVDEFGNAWEHHQRVFVPVGDMAEIPF